MNCAEFTSALDRSLDEWNGGDVALLATHAEDCVACRSAYEQYCTLGMAISQWRGALPEVDLVEAVLAARSTEIQPNRSEARRGAMPNSRRGRTYIWELAALSAALFMAVYLTTPATVSPTRIADSQTPSDHSAARTVAAENEQVLLGQAEEAYHRLARSAAGALEEFAVIVIPGAGEAPPRGPARNSEGAPLLEGLQHQLRPVGRSLGDALDFLWEVAPPADSRT